MAAKAKTAKPKTEVRNLTTFLRRLRPMLGENVEKVNPLLYKVNDRALIEISYFCRWDRKTPAEEKKTEQECYPATVKVEFCNDLITKTFDGDRSSGRRYGFTTRPRCDSIGFRPRVIRKNKSGNINLESIAVAVTKCCEAVDKWIEREQQRREHEKLSEKMLREEVDRLLKILPGFEKSEDSYSKTRCDSIRSKEAQCEIAIFLPERGDADQSFRYAIEFGFDYENRIKESRLIAILGSVPFIDCKVQPS